MTTPRINKIEKLKLRLKPVDYLPRLSSLKEEELTEEDRFYLKNFGIYNHKLSPERFNLRIRVPAGCIGLEALRGIHGLCLRHEASLLLTSRAQLEIHGLTLRRSLELFEAVEALGLTSWQTYTDNFRNVVTDPLDGLAEDTRIDVFPLVERMQSLFLKNPDFVGLIPRKFNTAITGREGQTASFFGNDLLFALAKKGEAWGFNLYAGGKNSDTARPLDIFARPDEVPGMFEAAATLYKERGPRESRSKARMFHLLERVGAATFRRWMAERLGRELEGAGELAIRKAPYEAKVRQHDGRFTHRYTTSFGEPNREQLEEIFALCEAHGIKELRIGCDQHFYLPGLPERVDFRHAERGNARIVACAGSKYCVYSLMDTKEAGREMGLEACERLGISVGFSGCLKGCARHAYADIGFVGIRTKLYLGEVERGVRLYLGARYTRGERAGRLILYAVPMRRIDATIDTIAALFESSGYEDFETYAAEVLDRYSEPALAFWLLLNLYNRLVLEEPLLSLPAQEPEEEKAFFIEALKKRGEERYSDLLGALRSEEAFPFREAIVLLERALFSVQSQA